MRPAVLSITGMHRSGTSLAASWLEACGLPIHQGRVWGPSEGNELGHFEDRDFEELHRGALLARWPNSLGWLAEEPVVSFTLPEREAAQGLLRMRGHHRAWGWKDPRSLIFLDDWFRLIPDLEVLAVVRPREAIIDSLLRRARTATNPHMAVTARQAARAVDVYEAALSRAQQRHSPQLLTVGLDELLANDGDVFDALQQRLHGALSYVPITDLYQPGHLGGNAADSR